MLWVWLLLNLVGSYAFTQFSRRGTPEALLVFTLFLVFTVFFRLIAALLSRCRPLKKKSNRPIINAALWCPPECPTLPKIEGLINEIEDQEEEEREQRRAARRL